MSSARSSTSPVPPQKRQNSRASIDHLPSLPEFLSPLESASQSDALTGPSLLPRKTSPNKRTIAHLLRTPSLSPPPPHPFVPLIIAKYTPAHSDRFEYRAPSGVGMPPEEAEGSPDSDARSAETVASGANFTTTVTQAQGDWCVFYEPLPELLKLIG